MAIDDETRQRLDAPAVLEEPRAAYIHIPFCRHRCGYCNFSVLAGRDDLSEAFLTALEIELRQLKRPRHVDTVFIGGGTPTHLSDDWFTRLMQLVNQWFPVSEDYEFSIEANPGDVTHEKLLIGKEHGVNRISLGVQSFNHTKLKTLERDHSPELAKAAVAMASECIGNVSIDLIFAAPGESPNEWEDELQTLAGLPLNHVSTYALTFEKGTKFWTLRNRNALTGVAEEDQLLMYQHTREKLSEIGFKHYEVSSFCKPKMECQHNLSYWKGTGWYAAGPGAARFIDGNREVNHRSPTTYINRLLSGKTATVETEQLTREQLVRERMAFGLRMLDGIKLSDIATPDEMEALFGNKLRNLRELGLLTFKDDRLALTDRGLIISDSVLSEIL